jgi:polyisoprenoid-binding protein YceI
MKENSLFYRTLLIIIAFFAVALLPHSAFGAETYEVDPVHSSISFRIKHLGIAYITGRFNSPTGIINIDESQVSNSSVEISVKVDNIDTNNTKRDTHLKSVDFFDEKKFPVISFKSKTVKEKSKDIYEITGDMSFHGVTRTMTISVDYIGAVKDPWGGYRRGFDATFNINRLDFGMKPMAGVGNDVKLTLGIEAIRK